MQGPGLSMSIRTRERENVAPEGNRGKRAKLTSRDLDSHRVLQSFTSRETERRYHIRAHEHLRIDLSIQKREKPRDEGIRRVNSARPLLIRFAVSSSREHTTTRGKTNQSSSSSSSSSLPSARAPPSSSATSRVPITPIARTKNGRSSLISNGLRFVNCNHQRAVKQNER